ncbi:adenylate cyclase [Nitrosopumilus sp. b1]|uniref:adenylate/guanylate cyclase domain-containing protein n=1 Tax=Nitrosopumilus sp. b1 TaxID=2109907 RepID=UPI0015F53D94|nr:adenylate/guanylate cyclase domain-containing protein [Nitrosopumilus sp. b1]KAF6242732.1 adenylate cyclase [Nitrosopumilus sp. b1]
MSKKEHDEQNSDESEQGSPNVVDMLLSKKNELVVDSETLIKETQKRVWAALKKGYEYSGSPDESDAFLRKHVFSRIDMVVLYVDLVGSTTMTLEMPEDKLAIIISSFAQEMAFVIRQYDGYVLKFVGDAVIGYFVAEDNSLRASDNAINCAKSIITVIEKGINPILNQYDYPDLKVKIGIDFGKNIVIRYGADEKKSRVDLMGPPMNIAAKIQSLAKPNQILIGDDVYLRIHPASQKFFSEVIWKNHEWRYRSRTTGNIYKVYQHHN